MKTVSVENRWLRLSCQQAKTLKGALYAPVRMVWDLVTVIIAIRGHISVDAEIFADRMAVQTDPHVLHAATRGAKLLGEGVQVEIVQVLLDVAV